MTLLLKKLPEEKFKSINTLPTISFGREDRAFGVLKTSRNEYKIAWRSDTMLPSSSLIKIMSKELVIVGIDQIFIIIDDIKRNIVLKLELPSNFIKNILVINEVFIATEFEIFIVDLEELTIIEEISLPDLFEDFVIIDDDVMAKCIDGAIIALKHHQ